MYKRIGLIRISELFYHNAHDWRGVSRHRTTSVIALFQEP
jgi:hypothetical protein